MILGACSLIQNKVVTWGVLIIHTHIHIIKKKKKKTSEMNIKLEHGSQFYNSKIFVVHH